MIVILTIYFMYSMKPRQGGLRMKKTRFILLIALTACLSISNAASFVAVRDTVLTIPEKPTTKDSITFKLFSGNFDCFTVFHDNKAIQQDSLIYLQYSYETVVCNTCACPARGSWVDFKIAPLAAGTYAIYAIGVPYCATTPCTMNKRAPTRMKTLTVIEPTTIATTHEFFSANAQPVKISMDRKIMHIAVSQSGVIGIRVFSFRGELMAKPFERFLSAGEHGIGIDHIVPGIQGKKPLIMEISIDGVRSITKTVALSHNR
jgi:hypothetical protein